MAPTNKEEIGRLLAEEARSLVGFITMLVGRRDLADEIFQEVCLEIWQARDRFTPGREFGAWARGVARNIVLRDRRRRGRERCLPLSPRLLEQLTESWGATASEPQPDLRTSALRECLGELGSDQRDVLRRRYNDQCSHQDLANQLGRSHEAVKMQIHRLRRKLHDCVERRLRREEIDAR